MSLHGDKANCPRVACLWESIHVYSCACSLTFFNTQVNSYFQKNICHSLWSIKLFYSCSVNVAILAGYNEICTC